MSSRLDCGSAKKTPRYITHSHVHTHTAYLVEMVALAQLGGLLPAVVAAVQVGGNAAELNQLVALQLLGQVDVVEVVVGVDAGTQALVVLLLDENLVESLVDSLNTKR